MTLGRLGNKDGCRRFGLTLAEVVLATGILGFIALTVVGVFLALLRTSAKNREQASAELLTESLLERAAVSGPPGWGIDGQIGVRITVAQPTGSARFFYQVDPLRINTGGSHEPGETWQVTTTVGWWLEDGSSNLEASRVGFGNQFVRGVRTVYWRDGEGR